MRAADAVRLAVAVSCFVRPTLPARMMSTNPTDMVVSLTRILAVRYGCQAALGALVTTRGSQSSVRWFLAVDAAVEACHAASMVPVAALFPDDARLATASGALAVGLAVADLKDTSRLSRQHLAPRMAVVS